MLTPKTLQVGDRVAIVSLSSGVIGEDFAAHQRQLGEQRLREFGLEPVYMANSRNGLADLQAYPEKRAADLKQAFADDTIKGVICAIGGDDTYRLWPFLMTDPEFIANVRDHPKIVTGFSDTTNNHLMFYRLGLQTYYGPNFLNDLAELDQQMLPYTKRAFAQYLTGFSGAEITSSPIWYEERTDFSADAVGTPRISHPETHGFEVLRGSGQLTGQLLGGCLESLTDLLMVPAIKASAEQYQIMPSIAEWQAKILFIETSEEQPTPTEYRKLLQALDQAGILAAVHGIIVGKPQNEHYYADYQTELLAVTEPYQTPILYNVNFGHAYPRCVLPYGAEVRVDLDDGEIRIMK